MTPSIHRRELLRVAAAAGLAATGAGSRAQAPAPAQQTSGAWPNRPVVLMVPFPAGGGTDTFARPLAAQFTRITGQSMVVDNRGGAGGTLGASLAAKAAPDGYTLFMGGAHHALAPAVFPRLDYDIQKDFVPLLMVASPPQVVVVSPKRVQQTTLQDFVAHAKANPGRLNYGSAGAGSVHHLAGELFRLQTGTALTHIPYRGAGPMLADLSAGNIDVCFDGLGSSAQHVKSGRIRALMVAGDRRNPALPDVPSAAEVGLPHYKVSTWYALWAVKGTPPDVVQRAIAVMQQALATDEIKAAWLQSGTEVPQLAGAAFGRYVDSEVKRWADVVKTSGAKIE